MVKRYAIHDLERELQGVKLAGRALSRQLVQSLGAQQAVHWYYHTPVPEFSSITPHAYVARHGKKGKERLASAIYDILAGQSE